MTCRLGLLATLAVCSALAPCCNAPDRVPVVVMDRDESPTVSAATEPPRKPTEFPPVHPKDTQVTIELTRQSQETATPYLTYDFNKVGLEGLSSPKPEPGASEGIVEIEVVRIPRSELSGPEVDRSTEAAAGALGQGQAPFRADLARAQALIEEMLRLLKLPRPPKPQAEYFAWDLKEAFISSAAPGKGAEDHPLECFTLEFKKVKVDYSAPKAEAGPPQGKVTISFGAEANIVPRCVPASHPPSTGGAPPRPRSQKPILIRPEWDASTPLIAQALVSNEEAPVFDLPFWTPIQGRTEVHDFKVTLTRTSSYKLREVETGKVITLLKAPFSAGMTHSTAVSMTRQGVSDPLPSYPDTASTIRVEEPLLKGTSAADTVMRIENPSTGKAAEMVPLARMKSGEIVYGNMGRHIPPGNNRASIVDTRDGTVLHQTDLKVGAWSLQIPPMMKAGEKGKVRLKWNGSDFPFRPEDRFDIAVRTDGKSVTFDGSADPTELRKTLTAAQIQMNEIATVTAMHQGIANMRAQVARQVIQSIGR